MDDYSLASLVESKNEWCSRLVSVLTPCIIEGLKSIFNEAYALCDEKEEIDKYLMTFQNFLSRVPKWNSTIIENEKNRIIEKSNCGYLEDLVTCVHIVQLKALTCSRVGTKQKKINIPIPSIDKFIHKVYINVARKVYINIYLFEIGITALNIQKNSRELEIIIKEMILNTIRENIPIENILKAYLDETEETEINVEEKHEVIPLTNQKEIPDQKEVTGQKEVTDQKEVRDEKIPLTDEKIPLTDEKVTNEKIDIQFSDIDIAVNSQGTKEEITAPKDIETLEEISRINNEKRKEEDDDDNDSITIGDDINLDNNLINDLDINVKPKDEIILKDIEIL